MKGVRGYQKQEKEERRLAVAGRQKSSYKIKGARLRALWKRTAANDKSRREREMVKERSGE